MGACLLHFGVSGIQYVHTDSSQNIKEWILDTISDKTTLVYFTIEYPSYIRNSTKFNVLNDAIADMYQKRHITTKQTHRHTSLQDGDTGICTFSSNKRPVDNVNRPVRRILSYSHTLHKQKISSLRIQGNSIPVQSPLLRSKHSTMIFT